ncbi:MAG: hypothetical protein SFU27_10930 [Thermonemataceae bacterium]|nr:hypothetical protein [Thermonemataceae bacterium]
MKNKLKKLGVLAVLLANVAIFAPQKIEGQNTTNGKLYADDGGLAYTTFESIKPLGGSPLYVCVKCGEDCRTNKCQK